MKKYARWIVFGLVAIGLIVLLLLFGANKKLRQQILALLLEKKVINNIRDEQDKATAAKAKAEANEISAEEAEKEAKAAEAAISEQKKALQSGLEERGLDADEIADRFRNLKL